MRDSPKRVGEGQASVNLTVRDHFAAAALTGLLANARWYEFAAKESHNGGASLGDQAAARAYNVADAMLAARTVSP